MIKIDFIDIIRYEAGWPYAAFLIADEEKIHDKEVVIFGVGNEAYNVCKFLTNKGIDIKGFVNNDSMMKGKLFCGHKILHAQEIWGQDYYVIVAMTQLRYANEVIWQLKVHGYQDYGLAFVDRFHRFDNDVLHNYIMEVFNNILCDGKQMNQICAPIPNVGPQGTILRSIPELCWTTTWSNEIIDWIYEKHGNGNDEKLDMLEIGPGKGVLSLVVKKINESININWLMYETNEQSEKAVQGRYTSYPANQFPCYYGMIENPKYHIEEKFDLIVMTEVMEHFNTNPIPVFQKIAGMLKENGRLYVSTPNGPHLFIYDDWKQMPDYLDVEHYEHIGHAYQYTKNEMDDLFEKCGLEIERYALADSNNHNCILKRKVYRN